MEIIPRSAWGARHLNGAHYRDSAGALQPVILRLPYDQTWFHHTVTRLLSSTATLTQECAAMRELEQIGQARFGQGISYTWLVFPSGRVYEGHGVDRRGAHTGGRNDVARAIAWVGNYSAAWLTDAQINTGVWLLRHNHSAGWARHIPANGGHRDLKATECPGDHAYAVIGEINRRASAPPARPSPAPTTESPTTEEDDMRPTYVTVIESGATSRSGVELAGRVVEITTSGAKKHAQSKIDLGTADEVRLGPAEFAELVSDVE